jgi:hypothetical protein
MINGILFQIISSIFFKHDIIQNVINYQHSSTKQNYKTYSSLEQVFEWPYNRMGVTERNQHNILATFEIDLAENLHIFRYSNGKTWVRDIVSQKYFLYGVTHFYAEYPLKGCNCNYLCIIFNNFLFFMTNAGTVFFYMTLILLPYRSHHSFTLKFQTRTYIWLLQRWHSSKVLSLNWLLTTGVHIFTSFWVSPYTVFKTFNDSLRKASNINAYTLLNSASQYCLVDYEDEYFENKNCYNSTWLYRECGQI